MDDYDSLKTNRPCKKCGDVRIIVADGLCSKCYYEPIYGDKNRGKVNTNVKEKNHNPTKKEVFVLYECPKCGKKMSRGWNGYYCTNPSCYRKT